MSQELCIMHANCQGLPLARLLLASPGFRARWRIRGVLNYEHEPLSDEDLAAATLFLYQNLTAKWETLASANVLRRLSPSAVALCIPNPFFKGYWPFWTNHNARGEHDRFSDAFLDHLITMGLSATEVLHIYLRRPVTAKYDLTAVLEESFEIEARREAPCVFKTLPWVQERWQRERVFTTINHPATGLLRYMADQVLAALSFPALTEADLKASGLHTPGVVCCDPAPDSIFELPIHPQVADFFGLPFGGPEQRYQIYNKRVGFSDYVAAYVYAREYDVDLLSYIYHLPTEHFV